MLLGWMARLVSWPICAQSGKPLPQGPSVFSAPGSPIWAYESCLLGLYLPCIHGEHNEQLVVEPSQVPLYGLSDAGSTLKLHTPWLVAQGYYMPVLWWVERLFWCFVWWIRMLDSLLQPLCLLACARSGRLRRESQDMWQYPPHPDLCPWCGTSAVLVLFSLKYGWCYTLRGWSTFPRFSPDAPESRSSCSWVQSLSVHTSL